MFKIVDKFLKYKIFILGPDHMTIVISPQHNVQLIDSSLTKEPPLPSLDWVDRKTYFIYYSYAEYKQPWTFSIDLQVCYELLTYYF